MENIVLWLIFMLLDLSMVLVAYKFFGKIGLYGVIVMSIIIANIQVLKLVDIFGFSVTLGNILYGSIFLATDILSEFHGKKEAQKGVWVGFFFLIISTVYMQIALRFIPAADDFAHPLLQGIFELMPRIVIASLIAYLISQTHDVWAFDFWKQKTQGKYLWLRNNASTLISQLIDSVIFSIVAFWGVFEMPIFWDILITTYLFKLLVAVADTPFMYVAKLIKPKDPGDITTI
jgi:hypothetical protein